MKGVFMKKFFVCLLAFTLSIGLLTACGGDDGSDSQADQTGQLVVGTNAEFPPFEYIGDDGQPDGFDIALIKAIGAKIGREVVIENLEFDSLVASIGTKIDVAIAGMTVTDERKEFVDFSTPYYEAVQFVIVPSGSSIASMADLEGKNIGVQLGTTGDFIVQDDIAGATAVQFKKAVDAVNDLVNGRLDCVIIDKNPALVFEERFEGQVAALDGAQFDFEPEYYAIAMPKGDGAFATQINNALQALIADGTFDRLVQQYIEE
jgi:polar amino acid transport system substrate-binding protein